MNVSISARLRVAAGALCALAASAWLVAPAAALPPPEHANRGVVELETGGTGGISVRIAEDLANTLDDGATRRVLPVVGKGALQNLADLRSLHGIDIAIVQSDVLDYADEQRLVPGLKGSVTYIAKLYNEEFHLLARPEIKSIEDLANKRVNFDVRGGGTAITATLLFDLLKLKVVPTSYDQSTALGKLKNGEIAAMAYVTGKPAPLFRMLTADDHLHLVAIPLRPEVIAKYVPTRFTAEDYPGLVAKDQPVDTVAVGAVLLAANLEPRSTRYTNLVNFVETFFTQFQSLLEPGRHPKWREVNLAAELPGWRRFPAADAWLKRNASAPPALSAQDLKEIFAEFLDERRKLAGGPAMSQQQKDELFNQFQHWQSTQSR